MTDETVHLKRVILHPEYTAGVILVHDRPICVAIERPWLDNKRRVSCIPEGIYSLNLKHHSPKFGKCWHVQGVPDRDHILFHVANRVSELLGCIAPGTEFGEIVDEFAVLRSRDATNALARALPPDLELTTLRVSNP